MVDKTSVDNGDVDKKINNPEVSKNNLEAGKNNLDAREIGNTGLQHSRGVVLEECNSELRYPQAISTYKRMLKDPVIAPAVELIENKIASIPWHLDTPDGADEALTSRSEIVRQMLFHDMESPFSTMIRQASTFNTFGFSVMEKVWRYRNYEYGSRYNDGYIGLRKIAPRSQDTIAKWKINKSNKKLLGLYQYKSSSANGLELDNYEVSMGGYTPYNSDSGFEYSSNNLQFIPREKFLHFVNNPHKDSPVGISPLNSCYVPFKYKEAYQKVEAGGVSKEAHGIKILYMPPEYMSDSATADQKAAYKMFQRMMMNLDLGESSSAILPLLTDSMGNKMFEMKVENLTGTSSYNLDNIINRYNQEMLTALFANVLTLGNSGGGSHALSESKLSIVDDMITSKLNIIKAVLNNDLIPQIFRLNGWPTEHLPQLDFGDVSSVGLEEFASAVQKIKAVGMMPKTKENVNWILNKLGSPYKVPAEITDEEFSALLGEETTRAGDGYASASGGLYGTADSLDTEEANTK